MVGRRRGGRAGGLECVHEIGAFVSARPGFAEQVALQAPGVTVALGHADLDYQAHENHEEARRASGVVRALIERGSSDRIQEAPPGNERGLFVFGIAAR